jgi:hypothetical protein
VLRFKAQNEKGATKMSEIDKKSNFIGQYFRQYVKQMGINRKILADRLDFNYSDNMKAICDYMSKKDYLWLEYEVTNWCEALNIPQTAPIYEKLINKAGKSAK